MEWNLMLTIFYAIWMVGYSSPVPGADPGVGDVASSMGGWVYDSLDHCIDVISTDSKYVGTMEKLLSRREPLEPTEAAHIFKEIVGDLIKKIAQRQSHRRDRRHSPHNFHPHTCHIPPADKIANATIPAAVQRPTKKPLPPGDKIANATIPAAVQRTTKKPLLPMTNTTIRAKPTPPPRRFTTKKPNATQVPAL